MLVNIGATEDDGMRSVREERECGRIYGGEHEDAGSPWKRRWGQTRGV